MAKKLKIHSKDELVHDVIRKFDERSAVGYDKYGTTLRGDTDSLHRWVNDVQEELMDAILYLQKVKETLTEELQEGLLKRYDEANYMYDKYPISSYPGECSCQPMRIYDAYVTNCTCK